MNPHALETGGSAASNLTTLIATDESGMTDSDLLGHIGSLIDAAADSGSADGTTRAFELLDRIEPHLQLLSPMEAVVFYYYQANAWANRRSESGQVQAWDWEQEEARQQILSLRRAKRHKSFSSLDKTRRCQVLTNLGSQLNEVGRVIEAIACWKEALSIGPRFAMARGSLGLGLRTYAASVYDGNHAAILAAAAHDALSSALADDAQNEADNSRAAAYFAHARDDLFASLDVDAVRVSVNWDEHSLGRSKEERRYRSWCLANCLFLNPLNDLAPKPLAAHDVMTLPSITTSVSSSAPPPIIGFFNQMKQEYVSARFMFFEGMHTREGHFSDRGVLLYNTLDYPAYGLGTERIRAAFRTLYSIFDKIAFFLNDYLSIGWPLNQVSLRGVWYESKGMNPKPLRKQFSAHPNLALRGLFWLTKEFRDGDFMKATDPDAEALAEIRNHLEHKYLQMHFIGDGSFEEDSHTPLAYSISADDFQTKTLRLLKYARAALIYLSLAVHTEERARSEQKTSALTGEMPLYPFDDRYKK